jgi:tripartite-type tricarboxylate transporter receptor subunit TctC
MSAMINRRDALTGALALSVAAALPPRKAAAQNWPSTYLKLLVGGAAGSVPDSLARLAADALSKKLGQAIIVENRAGAGGIIAMQGVAGSPPDGYTIGLATMSQLVFNSYLFSKLPYNPTRDLKPISTLAWSSSVLVAHPSLSASTLPEVVALTQKEPGRLLLGVPSNGSPPHIAALLLMRETGLSATIVPFKTGPDALTAAMRGDVQLLIDGPTLLASQVDSKAVKAIVVTGPQRFDSLKDVPTVAEAGFPNASAQSWLGLVASAGTPDAIIERLSTESQALLGNDEYVQKLKQMSFVPTSATPKEFAGLIADEHRRWAPVLQAAGLKFG